MIKKTLSNNAARNLEIDFVKGLLVLTMIVYHTFVNFYENYHVITSLTKYVSGGFIYISGFLIGFYYLKSYSDDYSRIRKRLFTRALKIFLVFLIANITLFKSGNISSMKLPETLLQCFLYGTGKSRFEILLPISYLLFITAIIAPYIKSYYIFLNIIVIGAIILIALGYPTKATNIFYLPIGLFGLGNSLLIGKIKNNSGLKILCLFLVILIGWLRLSYSFGSNYLFYVIYLIVVLMTFYNIAKRLNLKSILNKWILIYGKYLLFSYIYHLFIIVTLAKFLKGQFSFISNILIVISVNTILLISLVIIDNLRKRIEFIDRSYKFVFA